MTKHHKQTYCIFFDLQILDILESIFIKILYSFISDYHRMHGLSCSKVVLIYCYRLKRLIYKRVHLTKPKSQQPQCASCVSQIHFHSHLLKISLFYCCLTTTANYFSVTNNNNLQKSQFFFSQ